MSNRPCAESHATCAYLLQALPADEMSAAKAHIDSCQVCQSEFKNLQPVVKGFASWPADILRPAVSLQHRLADRIAAETKQAPVVPAPAAWNEPEWENVAPGIDCKLLAVDEQKQRVSMLVRLAPGATYPAHCHAGVEELHLLHGELWIDDRKLLAGDYNYGAPGATDHRVWSETGCTCLLVTSTQDELR